MLDELDWFPFVLAERLGKTLTEVNDMPNTEFEAFRAFYRVKSEMRKLHVSS